MPLSWALLPGLSLAASGLSLVAPELSLVPPELSLVVLTRCQGLQGSCQWLCQWLGIVSSHVHASRG